MQGNERALYVISVAAELAGVHPQTLRIYERKGLLSPARTSGRSRRYSERDIEMLRRMQHEMEERVEAAHRQHRHELVPLRSAALTQYRPLR